MQITFDEAKDTLNKKQAWRVIILKTAVAIFDVNSCNPILASISSKNSNCGF